MIGTKLGPYEILEEIGKGGMAAVYRARQPSVDRDVAIKAILKGIAGDPGAVQRFQREAKLIARLEHPHILPVYDFDGGHEPPYIVMRYLDGGTLKDVMAQGLLPHGEIAHLFSQVCSALDYAHRQGIVHRDIKPSNILIDREGNAFVSDLGIARITGGERRGKAITETGAIIGTPDYMSPEQAQGMDDVDHRTDIYALGVMLFEMLTGELPFSGGSGLQMLMMHIQNPVPSVLPLKPELPEALDSIVQQAMAKDRQSRYGGAVELSNALTTALGVAMAGGPTRRREAAATSIIRRMQGEKGRTDAKATPSEQNKTVTVLSASAAEYAVMVEESNGAEAARRAVNALWNGAERIIHEAGGKIFTRTDNELLALWGTDAAREDDAEQAVRTALALQSSLRELGVAFLDEDQSLPLNISLHRGLALLTPGEKTGIFSASGATISLANRLMQNAEGTILITHDVFRQVFGVFEIHEDEPLKVRGRSDKLNVYRVIAAKSRVFRTVLRGVEGIETQMVGRDAELKLLQKAFFMAVEDSETGVVTIVSEAGTGKSRLLYEFNKWAELRPEEFRIFSGRATPAMTPRPYALIRDMISTRFEVLDDDAPALALTKIEKGVTELIGQNDEMAHFIGYLVGIDVADSPYLKGILSDAQETGRRARQAFIRFITMLAKDEAVVLELEDIHHADDVSLDVLNELFTADDELHLLVIGCARPVLYERRPTWGSGQRFHTRIDLKPLDKRDSRDLVREILQKVPEVPKELRDLLVERAEGNPLFMEELVRMLLDDRVILRESDALWRVEASRLGVLSVPSTLAGLLEARFDTLLYPEKLTLQRAAVIGRIFYDTALQVINDTDETHLRELPDILAKLVERQFIYKRETSAFAGSVEYIFASAMLRDTLYDRLLERQQRVYHTGAAAWLAGLERGDDYLPLIAEHFEKAGDTQQAAAFLQRAGYAAAQRGIFRDAVDFYQRAWALLSADADSARRLSLLLALGEALHRQGDVLEARTTLSEALALARTTGNPEMLANALYLLSLTETTYGDYPAALAYLNEALSLVRAGSNLTTLANVLYGLANTCIRTGDNLKGIAAVEECIALCKTSGDDVLRMYALNRLATLKDSPDTDSFDPDAALSYYEQGLALARQIGHREGERAIVGNLGFHAAVLEDWQGYIRYTEQSLRLSRELGSKFGITIASGNLADGYIRVGMPEKVPPLLRDALLMAREMAAPAWLVSGVATAGQLKLVQGKIQDGLQLLGLGFLHPSSDVSGQSDFNAWLNYAREKYGMSDAAIQAELDAGKALDLDTVVDKLLKELE